MRTIALLVTGLSLASCTAITEGGVLRAPVRESRRPAATPQVAVVSSAPGDLSTSILSYHNDLEACRRGAAALGGGSSDDVAALKRALGNAPSRTSVSVSYRSDDLAVRRDRAVKTCLSKRGYILKD